MKRHQTFKTQGSAGLLVFAVIGMFVAGGTFLATFITSQRAKTPDSRVNLRLTVPSIPPRKPLESLPAVAQPTPGLSIETAITATETALPAVGSTPSATEDIPAQAL